MLRGALAIIADSQASDELEPVPFRCRAVFVDCDDRAEVVI